MSQIEDIISGNNEALQNFISKNSQSFTFTNLNQDDGRKKLWNFLFNNLQNNTNICMTLTAIRILSRDKTEINAVITENGFKLLSCFANLHSKEIDSLNADNFEIILESLKCLCNIIFNSTTAQELCSKYNIVDYIINRLQICNKQKNIPYDIKYFDMKLLFLVTALNTNSRSYLRTELNGLKYLTDGIEEILHECKPNGSLTEDGENQLSDNYVAYLCEVLKILFNITIKNSDKPTEGDEEIQYKRLVKLLRELLLKPATNSAKKLELQSHIINLLTCIPQSTYIELCPKLNAQNNIPKNMTYQNYNMEAVYELLKYMKMKLELQPNAIGQQETLSPILSTLTRSVRSVRCIRKYIRLQILPPLKEVHKRPEQGNTLRNYLCRLLTTPCSHVRDLTADFIFVLCKENVARMIKYTGYGNAAGLFATRGLMDGRNTGTEFSSESEDSDTEIYKEYRHGINPVIGCYEKAHPDPTAHMTEEQKEYEAIQLVNLMDKLTRSGAIQPCRIEDGRPVPVEHVLQLQEEGGLRSEQIKNYNKDDDD